MKLRQPAVVLATLLAIAMVVPTSASIAATSASVNRVAGEPNGQNHDSLVVRTADGSVRGARSQGVDSFLGIPYAAPPVGTLRWRPPGPVTPWSGVRDATRYGNRCAALTSTNGPESLSEDCLFINVQRPSGARRGAHIPVYTFFHGGGGINGSSDQHDGSKIVREGHIVVVTVNYRLGVFGGLSTPALTAEGGESGNYGFKDEQAALRWVHTNIADFGGDPARVTIGGESSGAANVCSHLSAPASAGLFTAAIIQSGPFCFNQPQTSAQDADASIAPAVHCTDPSTVLVCLRHADPKALLSAYADAGASPDIVTGTPTMPTDPRQNIATGAFAHVPVITGTNLDEARTFVVPDPAHPITESDYEASVTSFFGDQQPAVLAHYPWNPKPSDNGFTGNYLIAAATTDAYFSCGGNRQFASDLARYTSTWAYEFANRNGPGLTPDPVGYVWGAGHAAELAYLWPSFDNGTPIAATFDRAERRLASNMVDYWSTFVVRSRPSTFGLPRWPEFNDRHDVMSLNVGRELHSITDDKFARTHQCGFWDSIGY